MKKLASLLALAIVFTSIRAVDSVALVKKASKDVALSYGLAMGITAAHELGHALTAKIIAGTPIDISLKQSHICHQ